MRFWNGYQVKTLEDRGWAKVCLPIAVVFTPAYKELMSWLEEDQPGRYFAHNVTGPGFATNVTDCDRYYYFEDHQVATLFALKFL